MDSSEFITGLKSIPLIKPSVTIDLDGNGLPRFYVGYNASLVVDEYYDKARTAVIDLVRGPMARFPLEDLERNWMEEKLPYMASFIRCVGYPDSLVDFNERSTKHIQASVDEVLKKLTRLDSEKLLDKEFHKHNPLCTITYAFVIFGEEGQQLEEFADLETKELRDWPSGIYLNFILKVIIPGENGKPQSVDPDNYFLTE